MSGIENSLEQTKRWWMPVEARVAIIAAGFIAGVLVSPVVATANPDVGDAEPGTGVLLWGEAGNRRPLPMLDFEVEIEVTGLMAHGTVVQSFNNPTEQTVEAVYVFPLPESAAVHHMEIQIGERRIVSLIQEKKAARRTYEAASREGRKAALLEQERPNLFTTRVSGINPGDEIKVHLEYMEELDFDDGAFHLVFPLTITSRYGDTAEPQSGPGQRTESGTTIKPAPAMTGLRKAAPPRARLTVRLQAGLPLEEPASESHDITWWWDNEVMVIEPGTQGGLLADRDFHLRLVPQVGRQPEAALLREQGEESDYALLMVMPPQDTSQWVGLATETLFVVDISGSMNGPSMTQARRALAAAINHLHPDDSFNLLAFNDSVQSFAGDYVSADAQQQARALSWIGSLTAGGGTRIDLALETSLQMVARDETWRVERIVFLTDGAVSREDAVLGQIGSRLGAARLHTLGIGAAPNRYLMRQMAVAGRGLSDFISRVDLAENEIDRFLSRLSRPVLTDIALTWQGDVPLEVYPQRLPDLHAGEPLLLSARFEKGAVPRILIIEGRLGSGSFRRELAMAVVVHEEAGVAMRWAHNKVREVIDSLHEGADAEAVRQAVIEISKRFGIMTRYTSMVAVEEFPTAHGESRTVKVVNAVPAGQLPLGATRQPLLRLLAMFSLVLASLAGLAGRSLRGRRVGSQP